MQQYRSINMKVNFSRNAKEQASFLQQATFLQQLYYGNVFSSCCACLDYYQQLVFILKACSWSMQSLLFCSPSAQKKRSVTLPSLELCSLIVVAVVSKQNSDIMMVAFSFQTPLNSLLSGQLAIWPVKPGTAENQVKPFGEQHPFISVAT